MNEFQVIETENQRTILKFNYGTEEVGFDVTEFNGSNTMINATEMAKMFPGKRVNDFLRLDSTKEYIEALESDMRIPADQISTDMLIPLTESNSNMRFPIDESKTDMRIPVTGNNSDVQIPIDESKTNMCFPISLINVVQGGTPQEQGTWMHQYLALKFAKWLNPEFGIWCNQVVQYILATWIQKTNPDLENKEVGYFADSKNYVLDGDHDYIVEDYINKSGVIIPVPFDVTNFRSGEILVNVADMTKAYPNKLMGNFLRNNSTKEYIQALSRVTGLPIEKICKVVKGGKPGDQGTFMHQSLAIEFAQWLDPHFGIWCTGKVLEVLHKGLTTVYPEELQRYNATISALTKEVSEQRNIITENQPKVDFYDRYLNADNYGKLYTTTEAIMSLGIQKSFPSAQSLHKWLLDNKLAYRTGSGMLAIKAVHSRFGLLKPVTTLVPDGNGGQKVVRNMKWTERGLGFLGMVIPQELR